MVNLHETPASRKAPNNFACHVWENMEGGVNHNYLKNTHILQENKQRAQQACNKELGKRSYWELFSGDQCDKGYYTYIFLWVKRLLFAASLLASDNSTILCSSDLIFESIALIIWKRAMCLWDHTIKVILKAMFKKSFGTFSRNNTKRILIKWLRKRASWV